MVQIETMARMIALSIAKPCHENWENMTPVEQGVYCGSCCKNVVDFSNMPDEEIADYFQTRKSESTCGRFRNDQLNRPLVEISPSIFMMEIPFWKKFLAALFIYFSFFITGCTSKEAKDYTKAEVPENVSPKKNNEPSPAKADQENNPAPHIDPIKKFERVVETPKANFLISGLVDIDRTPHFDLWGATITYDQSETSPSYPLLKKITE